jgi:adenylate kinase family enzyme
MIYGVTGSGKTTLARQISERTGLQWYAIDDMTWEPGWVTVAPEEQRRRIAAVCARDEWIIDHGYSSWLDIVLDRVELIVALDYPRWLSLGRLIRRTLLRNIDHRPICNGNTETLRQTFSRESIIAWHFRSFARKRATMRRWEADPPPGVQVVRLTSPAATRRWLASPEPLRAAMPHSAAAGAGECEKTARERQ